MIRPAATLEQLTTVSVKLVNRALHLRVVHRARRLTHVIPVLPAKDLQLQEQLHLLQLVQIALLLTAQLVTLTTPSARLVKPDTH